MIDGETIVNLHRYCPKKCMKQKHLWFELLQIDVDNWKKPFSNHQSSLLNKLVSRKSTSTHYLNLTANNNLVNSRKKKKANSGQVFRIQDNPVKQTWIKSD